MPGERHGTASWPGVIAVENCTLTVSHGISPATAVLTMQPQDHFPDAHGNLTIEDGVGAVTFTDCKVDSLVVEQTDNGMVWRLSIVDRRWRWRELGKIEGEYNQLDPFGKLIPWTIRSPKELAKLCLEEMGESNYDIDNLPPGTEQPDPLAPPPINAQGGTGVNNTSAVNPPVRWDGIPPAHALQQLAELAHLVRLPRGLAAPPGQGAAGARRRGG